VVAVKSPFFFMSVAEKLNIIKQKINNNINAVKTRHTYSGNSIDVSSDILNITGKPLGQCLTYLRRPTETTGDNVGWTVPETNTVLGNGDSKIKFSAYYCDLSVLIDNTIIGNIHIVPDSSNRNYQFYYCGALGNDVKIGHTNSVPQQTFYGLTCSGYSYGDFTPKSNCVMEVIIDVTHTTNYYYEFNRILVRYINP